jgi:cation diffusion facilitator CzcD-associated flavoprotein CzcO
MSDSRPDYHCLIVGAGFSGIGVAIKLDAEGFGDYLIVEDADDVGGTWYWNTYPGIAVDIPSFSYQFSCPWPGESPHLWPAVGPH